MTQVPLDAAASPRHTILVCFLASPEMDPIRFWRIKAPHTMASDSQQGNPIRSTATTMKFSTVLSISLFPLISAILVTVDFAYDNPSRPLNDVSCSTGSNGLITRGFTTFGSLPRFPYIGATSAVEAFNSANCGSCWKLTCTVGGMMRSINITAIDHASIPFTIAVAAMNDLTGGHAVELGQITAARVDSSSCGLN
ncbi:Cerato-platanin-domain-containing protein [Infundibulicybe gibba]|nr:Cerato-platanin-domain-containing protein [Infundibulicybe gibba]